MISLGFHLAEAGEGSLTCGEPCEREPMLESPTSSDDEDADVPDPDGLDLVGCVACGESFASTDDLQQHQKDGCTEAALGEYRHLNTATDFFGLICLSLCKFCSLRSRRIYYRRGNTVATLGMEYAILDTMTIGRCSQPKANCNG